VSSRFACVAAATAVLVGSFVVVGVAPVGAAQSDDAIANAGLITQADLPVGYAPSTSSDDSDDDVDKAAKKIPACRALAALSTKDAKRRTTDAKGEDFETAAHASATSEISVYAEQATAAATQSALESPKVERCFDPLMTAVLQKALAQGVKELPKSQRKSGRRLDVGVTTEPGPGEDAITYHLVVKFGFLAGIPVFVDFVFLRDGRAVGFYSFTEFGNPPTTTETNVLPKVVARMTAAQA
jgi:hypothetical protein